MFLHNINTINVGLKNKKFLSLIFPVLQLYYYQNNAYKDKYKKEINTSIMNIFQSILNYYIIIMYKV